MRSLDFLCPFLTTKQQLEICRFEHRVNMCYCILHYCLSLGVFQSKSGSRSRWNNCTTSVGNMRCLTALAENIGFGNYHYSSNWIVIDIVILILEKKKKIVERKFACCFVIFNQDKLCKAPWNKSIKCQKYIYTLKDISGM